MYCLSSFLRRMYQIFCLVFIIFFNPVDLCVIKVSEINSSSLISIPFTKSPDVIPVAQKIEIA